MFASLCFYVKLLFYRACISMLVGILVGIALGLHLRKLVLEVYCGEGSLPFPRSLLNSQTLETLEIKAACGSILLDVPFPVCLKSLRTLRLRELDYKNDESVLNLLSGCCNLENLVVERIAYEHLKTFTISVPSLQSLRIIDRNEDSVYVVNAPCLKYLKGLKSCLIENLPELVEAKIDINGKLSEDIIGSLTSVKRFSLEISPLKLEYLELSTYKAGCLNLLTLMLDTSPNLQVLKLIGPWFKRYDPRKKWNQPKNVPECLLLHLETFAWTSYEGRPEDEKEVARCILKNASRLKKAVFSEFDETNSEERVLELVEELESMVRGSNSCQLVFK